MAEYIAREVLLSRLTFENGKRIPEVDVDNFPTTVTIRDIKKLIRDIPAANVASIVCCPSCGAKMDGGESIDKG